MEKSSSQEITGLYIYIIVGQYILEIEENHGGVYTNNFLVNFKNAFV